MDDYQKAMDEAWENGIKRYKENQDRLSYAILSSTGRYDLESQVIKYMRDGWKVSGGVFVTEAVYYQSMVRE